ncbi:MAG: hypothetical protein AAGA68_19460 [Pseudomonadota bacterium]
MTQHDSSAVGTPSYREQAEVVRAVLDRFLTLDEASRTTLQERYPEHIVSVSRKRAMLHVRRGGRMIVGRDRVPDLLPFLQTELPRLRARIDALSERLLDDANIKIRKSDPDLLHADYVDAPTDVLESFELLDAERRERVGGRAVAVGRSYKAPVGQRGRRRAVYVRPSASAKLLSYVLAQAEVLATQAPRRD